MKAIFDFETSELYIKLPNKAYINFTPGVTLSANNATVEQIQAAKHIYDSLVKFPIAKLNI
jgi:hypothetical protein